MQHPVFEQPNPLGWHTVVFPTIHDKSVDLDAWWMNAHDWIRTCGIKQSFSAFAHPKNRKAPDALSPVFFFKLEKDAQAMADGCNGVLLIKEAK